jgi:hypothetical protein
MFLYLTKIIKTKNQKMKKYEFKEVIYMLGKTEVLNKLGQEGWQLIAVVPQLQSGLTAHFAIFQREIK